MCSLTVTAGRCTSDVKSWLDAGCWKVCCQMHGKASCSTPSWEVGWRKIADMLDSNEAALLQPLALGTQSKGKVTKFVVGEAEVSALSLHACCHHSIRSGRVPSMAACCHQSHSMRLLSLAVALCGWWIQAVFVLDSMNPAISSRRTVRSAPWWCMQRRSCRSLW